MLRIGVSTMKAGMRASRWTMAASALLCLVFGPMVCNAQAAATGDPGAFAALGTVYFSSILHDSGFGSGGAGTPSPAGGGNHSFAGASAQRSAAAGGAGTTDVNVPGAPGGGDIDPGTGPVGSDTGAPGGSGGTPPDFPNPSSDPKGPPSIP